MVAVPAGVALIVHASGGASTVGAAVYAVTLVGLFGISASYHVHKWSPVARARMKKADHSMIYIFIAGTYTPLCLGVLTGVLAPALLIVVWFGAGVGVLLQFRPDLSLPRTGSLLYIVLGWLALVGLPQLVQGLDRPQFILMVAGGLVYTLGAVVLGTHWPDPVPGWFGYHEVWHCAVAAACACHYVMLWSLL